MWHEYSLTGSYNAGEQVGGAECECIAQQVHKVRRKKRLNA